MPGLSCTLTSHYFHDYKNSKNTDKVNIGFHLKTLDLRFSADDLAQIEQAIPKGAAAGERYPAPLMALLDSERGREQDQ